MSLFSKLLLKTRVRQLEDILVRAVPVAALFPAGEPASPDFLFTSGKQNRFNPPGTHCLYFSESELIALAEYRRQFHGIRQKAKQPVILFFAEVRLQRVVDLCDGPTCRMLGLSGKQLESNWGGGLPLTPLQRLGGAVATQSKISAIRYPSVAAMKAGFAGANIVVFKSNVCSPDFVRILGPTKKPIQEWP